MRQLIKAIFVAVAVALSGASGVLTVGTAFAESALSVTPAQPQYYFMDGAERRGPIALAEIQKLIATNVVRAETMVWTAGMANWARADTVADLAPSLPPAIAYYVMAGSQRLGPALLDVLVQRIQTNATAAGDFVWKAGLATWARVDTLPELTVALPQTIDLPMLSPTLSQAEREKTSMVLGATLAVMFHELGHALIGELGVPSTGPEEDSVDEFSALLLSTAFKPSSLTDQPPELQVLLNSMVRSSTLLWNYDSVVKKQTGNQPPWYDAHSDSIKRFRNTLCLIYGSDPRYYKGLADAVKLPEETRQLCTFDYPKRLKAWQTITAPFIRDPGDGSGPLGNQPADTPGGKVTVVFTPSNTGTGQKLLPVFEASGIFSGIASVLEKNFVWKRDMPLVFEDCHEMNAYYDPTNHRIRMCWEGVEYFAGVILDALKVPRHN